MTISDALHRLLLDNLTTATILLDAELRLEYMNPAAEMLLAISGQRSHGQFISELFTESTEALNSLRQAVEQDGTRVLVMHSDGERHPEVDVCIETGRSINTLLETISSMLSKEMAVSR